MSYELDEFCSFYYHSSPEMVSSAKTNTSDFQFFSDPFSPFCDSAIEIFQSITTNQNPVEESYSFNQFAPPSVLSSSPPSHQLENLSIYDTTQMQSGLEVKTEVGFDCYQNQTFMAHSYSGCENVGKYMQRSLSSNCFDAKPGFLFQPQFQFDPLMESQDHNSENINGQMRRVCSTGDLQTSVRKNRSTQRSFSSPLATESSLVEDASFKVGRYSAEERKERISKYRAKRTQRNFNKTIKYACRKTLADNRPRIRGRFARNDEVGDIPKVACSNRDEVEYELWVDELHEEEEEEDGRRRGGFVKKFGQAGFRYY